MTPELRRALASEIDRLDAEIEILQNDKREYFKSYRDAHGKAECDAAKVAIKRRQKHGGWQAGRDRRARGAG